MTMTMANSLFGPEDMEALLWEPSFPTADTMSTLFHPDQEEHHKAGGTSLEGATSPVSPLTSSSMSCSSSPPPFYSPPQSPLDFLLREDKDGTESDLFTLPWLGEQLRGSQTVSDDSKDDLFSDMHWMTERVDLNDSLIGSCNPAEESPSSPENILASLDCPMELDSLPAPALSSLPSASPPSVPPLTLPSVCSEPSIDFTLELESQIDRQGVLSPPPCVPEPQEELEIKSEPVSPDPFPPVIESPSPPDYTLDLGSEVDVPASEVKPVVAPVDPKVPRLVISLSPTRIVLILAPKDEVGITTTTVTTVSEVIHSSVSPPPRPSRSRPYPEPKFEASTSSLSVELRSPHGTAAEERATFKAPKNKKLKKMEQNKTAATRYRQKKKAEQDALGEEYAVEERKNMELTERAESMAREIKYLKELMEEVQLARIKAGLRADP